jgi:hypothetical protein
MTVEDAIFAEFRLSIPIVDPITISLASEDRMAIGEDIVVYGIIPTVAEDPPCKSLEAL